MSGRYDKGERRKSHRKGRERGCWVYIPAEELQEAGVDPYGTAPFYRVWAGTRGGIRLRLYKSA